MSRALTEPISSSFREDAPRPPVPGEEGEAPCFPGKLAVMMRPQDTAKAVFVASLCSSTRRNDDGLGEPEGSASPDSPLARWTKSLHSLLGDQDGALLFRTFLEREKCVDTLDFWFACNGFRQMDLNDSKTHRVAKAIYKRYIENNCVVAKQLKPATKTFIRDNIKKQQIDSAMFDQAQTEIQTTMEENAYQMFLTSDIYLDYVRSGGENPSHVSPGGLGSLKLVCGYLPTLNEEEEWSCDFKAKALVGLSAQALRATVSLRTVEVMERGYRPYRRGEPDHPYHVGSFAPTASTNDSEVSSDAATDDSMSMTDSSVEGIPPYKAGTKKHLQREMQRNMRMNSQVSLPAFPRARRPPKEMTPVEPAAFAAQLILRLERLRKEQETISSLEEMLQQIQEEEEREEAETPSVAPLPPPHSLALLPAAPCDDDAQAILDEHLSRVLKTPGCQSPAVARRRRSPERRPLPQGPPGAFLSGFGPGRTSTKHVHHHYIHHHHAGAKSQEQIEREAALRVQGVCPGEDGPHQRSRSLGRELGGTGPGDAAMGRSSSLSRSVCCPGAEEGAEEGFGPGGTALVPLPGASADRLQNVCQWILESGRQGKHKACGAQSTKKWYGGGSSSAQTHTWGGGGQFSHARGPQPAHPFIQDPAMPPLPPPNTLAQLEEARRRLEEVSNGPNQRHLTASLQREKGHPAAVPSGAPGPKCLAGSQAVPAAGLVTEELKRASCGVETVVTYFFCGEEIPYRRTLRTHCLTLASFKEQLRKKGNYRYYFKKASDEFECGAVFEEVWEDSSLLPTYHGKILGKVERMD